MTVRLLLNEKLEERERPARGRLSGLEFLLLLVGLIAVDYYVWVGVNSAYYQDYQSWSFDRQVHHRPASLLRFVEERLGLVDDTGDSASVPESAKSAPAARPQPRSVIGRIEVPRLRITAMVREGDDENTLLRAVGHIPSTALPGETGNVGLAGHRDTFFRKLQGIKRDDRIVVSTLHGDYEYQVDSLKIVMPEDVEVLQPMPGEQSLTLVTCYPFYYVGSAPKRFIVHARQVEISSPQPQQTGS